MALSLPNFVFFLPSHAAITESYCGMPPPAHEMVTFILVPDEWSRGTGEGHSH
jgi:hypothetical protein